MSVDAGGSAARDLLGGFAVLALISFAVFVASVASEGAGVAVLSSPGAWLQSLDRQAIGDTLLGAAQVVAGVLAIAITVSAIVVELAANRYNHRITWLFVSEPVNTVVMSIFVVTTVECIWIAADHDVAQAIAASNAAFAITMALVTICLLLLLPYFLWVFRFLSPLSVIDKIRGRAYRAIERATRGAGHAARSKVQDAIDELQDIARIAAEQSDRSVAMACVNALKDLVVDYQSIRAKLPAAWFTIAPPMTDDPDFVSLAPSLQSEIESQRLWVETKIFQQYLALMSHGVTRAREVVNLIAIDTFRVASVAAESNGPLLGLCIRCFNSYLNTAINAGDRRTAYYVMNQYRVLAEELMARGLGDSAREIAGHFKFFGQLAHRSGHPFLLEAAAYDACGMVEASLSSAPQLTDDLLAVVLDLDQEIKSDTQEPSLIGVRRAQLQLATLFADRRDEARARRICADLAGERLVRLERLRRELESETRQYFWEFTERHVNFRYLPPERRAMLPVVFGWIVEAAA